MDLFSNFDVEAVQNFLSEAAKADISAWSLKIGVVWWLLEKKVLVRFKVFKSEMQGVVENIREDFTKHFASVETALKEVVTEMSGMKKAIASDLASHSEKLGRLEQRVEKLETKKGEL